MTLATKRVFKRSLTAVIGFAMAMGVAYVSHASTFECNGKQMYKGEVIEILIKDPKADCVKKDKIEFDKKKGTIKNAPKE